MQLTITMSLDNAAFHEPEPNPEASRLLRKLAGLIDAAPSLDDGDTGPLIDANGNKVGAWSVTDAE